MKIDSLLFALLLTATPAFLHAQAGNALLADVPPGWEGLIGEYGTANSKAYVLEKDGSLYFRSHDVEERLAPKDTNYFRLGAKEAIFSRSVNGDATLLTIGGARYPRLPSSAVSGGVFRIEPLKPAAELTRLALADHPPAEQGEFRPADLVEVATLDRSIKLDIRYASANNFLSTPVYTEARAFLQRPAAEAVVRASRRLKPLGYGLLIHDAYRPWYVTKVFWDATPASMKQFVADPAQGSRHNRGCAVDITFYDLQTGKEISMTGVYDEMSERSYPNYPGGTSRQRWRRDLLRKAMEQEGFTVFESEWWHFDYKDWRKYRILNIAFNAIQPTTMRQRIAAIMARPQFAHARFGIEFYSLDANQPVYTLNSQELFVPGSTTKLLTEGTALELLGAEYRFHTFIYRTGAIQGDTLHGDLVLVASGDPYLSNRIQPDGTLAFEDHDHSYGGAESKGLKGDPLLVLREFARQIAAQGIKKVKGHILVDASLFPEGEKELGTGVVLSPMAVNDNVVDVIASPGATEGAPVQLRILPKTRYVTIVNKATTGKAGSTADAAYAADTENPDGTRTVTLSGSLPLGSPAAMMAYRVPAPSLFAAILLEEALKDACVRASVVPLSVKPDFKSLASNYTAANVVAQHVSPPLKEEVKVTLKVSQNLHASMTPYLLGALLAKKSTAIDQAGFDLEHDLLAKAGLDLTAASQSDGAGGNAYFTPDFITHICCTCPSRRISMTFDARFPFSAKTAH